MALVYLVRFALIKPPSSSPVSIFASSLLNPCSIGVQIAEPVPIITAIDTRVCRFIEILLL